MPLSSALAITLSAEQQAALERLVRAHGTPQQLALRARIILLADNGIGVRATARELLIQPRTVRQWRQRWRVGTGNPADRLADAPRAGAPARFTAEQVCAIIALACERPSACGRPITHWSQNELAREAVKRGLASSISQRSVGRMLKRGRPEAAQGAALAHAQARF
jgi:putative transposase